MNGNVSTLAARMSLRAPQRESLARLDRICDLIGLRKDRDLEADLATIRAEYPQVESFERDFASFCFALATGVGKTRLMGAFIAYLAQAHGVRHFFVLAPNLTIYRKLIADFTPGTSKYVFQGIPELATQPPELITGENYEQGRGIRDEALRQRALFPLAAPLHINVFNISKINSEVRGGRSPRIKRLSEYIGESYFDYLAKLQDLVLLMDESHRYRALAGMRAINELRPVLGLELTATPQVERGGRSEPFGNVVYSYPLARAMDDGFVKEPAVATRPDFDPAALDAAALEQIKLEDGIRLHENTKAELEVYARQRDLPLVKPFVLVIARDIDHAAALKTLMESDGFFAGRYRERVLVVHSKQTGEEGDEVVEQLLGVERHDNPIEIVVHVNMLKEGWDVTNLYTIVPLRTASSATLVEQSIGRGLRLPYGMRTQVPAVDRLTIVAHDKFQEILDYARSEQCVMREVMIGPDVPLETRPAVVVPTRFELAVQSTPAAQRAIAEATVKALRDFESLPTSRALAAPAVQQAIVERVTALLTPQQLELLPPAREEIASKVAELTSEYGRLTIDVPRILVLPRGNAGGRYETFTLEAPQSRPQPYDESILVQHLHDFERFQLEAQASGLRMERLEDPIVFSLMDEDDVSYDEHAELLYDLAGQMTAYLKTYLTAVEVENVVQGQHRQLASLIHAQMRRHYVELPEEYEVRVTKGFVELKPQAFTGERRDVRQPPPEKRDIGRYVFYGFAKSVYPETKLQSDPERRFALILEQDLEVEKWFRPETRDLRIFYSADAEYRPDFIVESADSRYLVEVKRRSELTSAEVQAKARAALAWCAHATAHAERNDDKPWRYVLLADDRISENQTFAGLVRTSIAVP